MMYDDNLPDEDLNDMQDRLNKALTEVEYLLSICQYRK